MSVVRIVIVAIAGVLLAASIACLILIQLGYPRIQGVIAPNLIRPASEQSYTVQLPQQQSMTGLFSFVSDGPENSRVSNLELFEDGVAIGPPHTAHVEIAKSGGSYSHWNGVLYFSSTRGDDPRTSGREYRIVSVYVPVQWLEPALVALMLLSLSFLLVFTLGRSTFTILGRIGPPMIYAGAAIGVVATVFLSLVDVPQIYTLQPSMIRAAQGHSYAAEFPADFSPILLLEPVKANRNSVNAPVVRLLENGQEFGMARSMARFVESIGEGRYIVTGSRVLFSTLDNSDPRTNGRTYGVRQRLALSPGAGAGVALLIVASLILLAQKRSRLVLGGMAVTAAAGGIYGLLTHVDVITHDEFVSPANVYHVTDQTYGFIVNGTVAPFIAMAPVGAPTAVGIGNSVVMCERHATSPDELSRVGAASGKGACGPRGAGTEIDFVVPAIAGEGATVNFYRYPVRMHLYAVAGLLLASVLLSALIWLRPTPRQALTGTGALVGGAGALLMAANLWGSFSTLRVTAPTEAMPGIRHLGPRLPLDDGVEQLAWTEGDTAESYARRINQVIYKSMVHGNPTTDPARWRLEIPIWESWSLHALGAVNPNLQRYRFWDHEKEFERGIGLCGDLSAIMVGYLMEHGVRAKTVGLHGHVVVTVEVAPDVWHIFDPDYGVVLAHSLEEVQNDPALIEATYREATYASDVRMIVGYYTTPENNSIDQSGRDGFFSGLDGSAEIYRSREQFMELLKWVVPSIMLIAGMAAALAAFLWRGRQRKAKESLETAASAVGVTEAGPV